MVLELSDTKAAWLAIGRQRMIDFEAFKHLLLGLGEDPEREGFATTPERVRHAWEEMLRGYTMDPEEILSASFENEDTPEKGLHLIEDVSFSSLCEHHLLGFSGFCSVAYIPNKTVVGLSKVARLVECFACRLQIQERMVAQIADALMEVIEPRGVAIVASARHSCCTGRGVRSESMNFVTTTYRGEIEMQLLQTMTMKIRRH
jgi:GTP cyclohydrolase I